MSQPASPRSSYLSGSAANMIRSVLVVLAGVLLLMAIVPRVTEVQQPAVDARSVVEDATRTSGTPFELPSAMPDGSKATSARFGPGADGLATWQAGWLLGEGAFVGLKQTRAASPAWIDWATGSAAPMVPERGGAQASVTAGQRTWLVFVDHRRQLSLVSTPPDQVATVVSGTGSVDELRSFADLLRPVVPR